MSIFDKKTNRMESFKARYHKPKKHRETPDKYINFDNAVQCASNIDFDTRTICFTPGTFIFGELPEAICYRYNLSVSEMYISTLSLSVYNIQSLKNLMNYELVEDRYVHNLTLITSDFHYRKHPDLYNHAVNELDLNNSFQLCVCAQHTKIVLMKTDCGKFICIYGSANLESSDCLELFTIENNESLFNFLKEQLFDTIISKYHTIDKSKIGTKEDAEFRDAAKKLRGKPLWEDNFRNTKYHSK